MEKSQEVKYWTLSIILALAIGTFVSLKMKEIAMMHGGVPIPGHDLEIFLWPAVVVFIVVMFLAIVFYSFVSEDIEADRNGQSKQKK